MLEPYYADDLVTIYHGDCRDVLPLVSADVCVADPPYGMGKASWDVDVVPVDAWLPLCRRVPTAVFCGVQGMYDYPRPDWVAAWVRLGSTQRNGALRGFNNWEPMLMYGISALANDVISVPNRPNGYDHPTTKPLELIARLLTRLPAGCVLDPFMGSGTTLRAAKNLGRSAIGIDQVEAYCEIAAERCRQEVLDLGGAA